MELDRPSHTVVIRLGALVFALGGSAVAHPQTSKGQRSMPALDTGWVSREWTAQNGPFLQARREVDRELAGSRDLKGTLRGYEERAKANPQSALDQFRWGYGMATVQFPPGPQLSTLSRYREPRMALAMAPDPKAAEYARLRFLIETYVYPYTEDIPPLVKVGKRLHARDASDRFVAYSLACILRLSKEPKDQDLGVTLARRLLVGNEDNVSLVKLTASSYGRRYELRKLPKDRDQAIAYYRKMSALTIPGDVEQRFIDGEIRRLRGLRK